MCLSGRIPQQTRDVPLPGFRFVLMVLWGLALGAIDGQTESTSPVFMCLYYTKYSLHQSKLSALPTVYSKVVICSPCNINLRTLKQFFSPFFFLFFFFNVHRNHKADQGWVGDCKRGKRQKYLSPKCSSQQLCYGHCLCDSAPHSSSNNNCGVHWLLHNGEVPTVLTDLLFWWWSTGSSVILGRSVRSIQHSLILPPTLSLIGHVASVDIKLHVYFKHAA